MADHQSKKNDSSVPVGNGKSAPKQGRGSAWRLAEQIRQQIADGEYSPGDRLPSYRDLMGEHDLTSGTVSYAMSILAQQGCVERRHGSGVYVEGQETLSFEKSAPSGLLALVVPDIESGVYLSLQAGMEQASQKNQEQLITITTKWDLARQADVLLQLIARGVSGIALVPPYEATPSYQMQILRQAGIPLVLLHRGVPEVQAPLIEIPFMEAARLAGAEIGKHGHRHTAALMGIPSQVSDLYLSGLRRGLRANNVELSNEHIIWSEELLWTSDDFLRCEKKVEEALLRMCESPDRPTAVFASFDRLAELVYHAAMRIGLRIPDDLSIICFGSKHRGGAILPRLATVAVDERETGRKAHELLASMRNGDRPLSDCKTFRMPLSFIKAKTLAPPPRYQKLLEPLVSTE